ncbi:two-component sensor histidine kinase [Leifsonia shinshuensis]|uniref:sensor histidine kinase n=1 Tax=Leifsonia shinshuensis TaxID=150026 RepID=UPI001F50C835|nr:histidine kinase [Leifsonia shinshuensis]MCI0157301.1 two-component sensor histidine kinase [Leifsonia shinshuensis]
MFSSDVDEYRPVGVWARLTHRSAFRWYPGAVIGLLYQISVLGGLWTSSEALATKIVATALLALVYLGFLALPPLLWWEGERTRLIGVLAYFALTLTLIPFIGVATLWTWVYVACAAGMAIARTWVSTTIILGLGAVQLIVFLLTGTFDDNWYIALITVSIGIMMSAFARQIDALRRLRRAQGEIARLAVVEERARFSRDMHDVLGHSLTVVTVKSELARRLIPVDPGRAEEELADIERLTRSALADLRAAVAGYREMSLSTELAAAQAGLAAADIQAHLPRNGEEVAPDLRELFGWVLREGVTNVIRHSGSRNCWVTVEPEALRIEDDGRGPAPFGSDRRDLVRGSGIAGLAARAGESGAALTVEAGPRGGTLLTVRRLP